jgi:copper chaperone CopZ
MSLITLKTSLKCSGCVSSIQDEMDRLVGKDKWSIDLKSIEKTLELRDYGGDLNLVINALKDKGYTANIQ